MTEGIIQKVFDNARRKGTITGLANLDHMEQELIKEISENVESSFCPICIYREEKGIKPNNHRGNLLHQACINRYKKKLIGDTKE